MMRIAQFAIPAVMYTAWYSNHSNLTLDTNGCEQAITFQAHTNLTLTSTYCQPNQLNPGVFLTSPFDHDLLRTNWYFTKFGRGNAVKLNSTNKSRRSYGRGRRIRRRTIASECSTVALIFALIDWMLMFFGFPSLRETLNIDADEGSEGETGSEDIVSGSEGLEMGIQLEESPRLAGLRDGDDGDGWAVRCWGRGYGWDVGCGRD